MICNDVQKLIDYAIKKELITNDDIYVVRNQLMETKQRGAELITYTLTVRGSLSRYRWSP